jgi:hypothetical protein
MFTKRSTGTLVATAAAAFVLAGCAATSQGATSGSVDNAGPIEPSAVSYAACLRENGIQVPDPDASGALAMPEGYDRDDPAVRAAEQACADHLPAVSEEERASNDEEMLAMARCMRENGVDIADPINGEVRIPMVDQEALDSALEVCSRTLAQGAAS